MLTGSGLYDLGSVGPWRVAWFNMTGAPIYENVRNPGTPDRVANLGFIQPADTHFDGVDETDPIAYGGTIWLNFTRQQWVFDPNNNYFQYLRYGILQNGIVAFDIKT